jgi:glycosyltransferase involved in cell wall biosynthesis
MTISVVIATRNRARLLGETLAAIVRQNDPGCPFEIVVVDNGSSDNTLAVVETVARGANVPVRCLSETKPGKSYALNTAFSRASGDLLVLTDDDVLPTSGWLRAYADVFRTSPVDFAAGRIVPLWEAQPPRWLSPALYGVLAVPDGGPTRVRLSGAPSDTIMPIGANMAIRRSVVERVGGWNPALGKLDGTLRTGEDHEFALKMFDAGLTGVYEPRAEVAHRVPADRLRRSYFRQWFAENGAIEAGLEIDHPTTSRYIMDVPAYLWRAAAGDVVLALCAMLSVNRARLAAAEMRLVWFVGYVRARRSRPRAIPRSTMSATAPRH